MDNLRVYMEVIDRDIQEMELKVEDNQEKNSNQSLNQSRLKDRRI